MLIGSSREQVGFTPGLRAEVLARNWRAKAIGVFPFLAGVNVLRAYAGLPALHARPPAGHRAGSAGCPGCGTPRGHEGAGIGLSGVTGDLLAAQLLGLEPAGPRPRARSSSDRPSLAVPTAARRP